MVKLRGINVYPQGIGALLTGGFAEATGEYVCRVDRGADRLAWVLGVEFAAKDRFVREIDRRKVQEGRFEQETELPGVFAVADPGGAHLGAEQLAEPGARGRGNQGQDGFSILVA